MSKPDKPAFPTTRRVDIFQRGVLTKEHHQHTGAPGLSRRELFVKDLACALLSNPDCAYLSEDEDPHWIASRAEIMADTLIERLDK